MVGRKAALRLGAAIPITHHIGSEPTVEARASPDTGVVTSDGNVLAPIVFRSKLDSAW